MCSSFLWLFFSTHNLIEFKWFLNRYIWPIDRTLTNTTTLSNDNEEVLHTLQISNLTYRAFKKDATIFDNFYLNYFNFFIVIANPISEDSSRRYLLDNQVKPRGISLRTLGVNKDGWLECYRSCTLPVSQNLSTMHNIVDFLGSVEWENFIFDSIHKMYTFKMRLVYDAILLSAKHCCLWAQCCDMTNIVAWNLCIFKF